MNAPVPLGDDVASTKIRHGDIMGTRAVSRNEVSQRFFARRRQNNRNDVCKQCTMPLVNAIRKYLDISIGTIFVINAPHQLWPNGPIFLSPAQRAGLRFQAPCGLKGRAQTPRQIARPFRPQLHIVPYPARWAGLRKIGPLGHHIVPLNRSRRPAVCACASGSRFRLNQRCFRDG